jgi:cytochrome c5
MQSEKDSLSRALGRLGHVPREVLAPTRERIRGNLKAGRRPMAPLPPLPDAAQVSLAALYRPFFVGGAAAAVCVLIAIGAMVQWRPEARSASKETPESHRQTIQPSPPGVDEPPAVKPERQEPVKRLLAKTGTQPAVAAPPPVQTSPSQARFTLLPPGEGKVILDRACGGCHRAAAVGTYHFATRAEYTEVVSRMIEMGAPVSEQDAEVLINYLFDNLRIKPEPVDTAGQAILERACTTCHSLNGIEKYAYDSEDPYRELVSTMVTYGAALSEAEKTTLVRYLFATYGKR